MSFSKSKFLSYHGRTQQESRAAAAFVQKNWPEETAHRLRIANEVTENKFLFDLPWDMERTVELVDFKKEINWFYMPGDDPEYIYQLNRHRYWVCLGQAYQITGDEKYADAFAAQLTDWVEKSPLTDANKPLTWRTIETGLRAENWIKAMGYMAESPAVTEEVFDTFMKSLIVHGEYLYGHDVPFSVKSNWGVLENNGLYAIGKMLTGCADAQWQKRGQEFAALALKRLERQIITQVQDDGVHWEQSPMYHNEVLKCYMETLRVAALYGDQVPETITSRVKKMVYADRMWQCPNGCQPAGGDSDVTDLRDILSVGALQFHDPVLKSGGCKVLDYEGIWDYGMEANARYETMESELPEDTFTWMKESGNFYLRSGWERDADYLHVRCGSLGGGHGHCDKLHFDLMINGEDVFVDPGRFTYVDSEDRARLKSARGHNVLTVDGEEYTQYLGSWSVKGLNPAVNGGACQKGEYTFIQCGHLGYADKGIFVNRKILAVGTKAYIIADEFYGEGTHTYRQHFHTATGKTLKITGNNTFTVTGRDYQVKVCCLSDGVSLKAEEFGVSRHYNQMEPGEMLTFERTAEGNGCMVTVILCEEQAECMKIPAVAGMNGRELTGSEADAVCLKLDGKTYAALIAHVETGEDCEYIGCMERFGLGRVMICNTENEETMTVLAW